MSILYDGNHVIFILSGLIQPVFLPKFQNECQYFLNNNLQQIILPSSLRNEQNLFDESLY